MRNPDDAKNISVRYINFYLKFKGANKIKITPNRKALAQNRRFHGTLARMTCAYSPSRERGPFLSFLFIFLLVPRLAVRPP